MASSDPYSHNPYAPSRASLGARSAVAEVSSEVSVWRDGKVVVTLPDASLPPRCVKCNAPADQPTKERTLYWVHPAVYLLIFGGGLILLIVYMVVRKKADVNPGLCDAHKKRRLGALAYGWLGFFGGFLLACIGGAADSGGSVLLGADRSARAAYEQRAARSTPAVEPIVAEVAADGEPQTPAAA